MTRISRLILTALLLSLLIGCQVPDNDARAFPDGVPANATEMNDFYYELVNDYYEVDGINDMTIYRSDDTVHVAFDISEDITYSDFSNLKRFATESFILRRGQLEFSPSTMGGPYASLYDLDYEFWNALRISYFIEGNFFGEIIYTLGDENTTTSTEIDFDLSELPDVLLMSEAFTKPYKELQGLENGAFYKSPADFVMHLKVSSFFKWNTGKIDAYITDLEDRFGNADEYLKLNYPVLSVVFENRNGIYEERTLVVSDNGYHETDVNWDKIDPVEVLITQNIQK